MNSSPNIFLILGAVFSSLAALLHVGVILGGGPWYRFFGAGEKFASAAEAGKAYPAVVTAGIALMLAAWAGFALSGAGVTAPWPFLKFGLSAITAIYLLRGAVIFPMLLFARSKVTPLLLWSSAVCLVIGGVHLVGLAQVWETLA